MQTTSPTKERNYLLDNVKGLLIFLVVFGHSLELYKENDLIIKTIFTFIYLFHMPAFVFISGYFSKNLDKCRNGAFKSFLLPFLVFNTFWNVLTTLFTSRPFSFITPGWALWYLISMFIWRLFLKDLVKIRFIVPISILIGLGAGMFSEFSALLSLSRSLVFLPFFLVGYFISEERLVKLKKPSRFFAFLMFLFTLFLAFKLADTNIFPIEFLYGSGSFASSTVPIWLGLTCRFLLYLIGFYFIFVLVNTMTSAPTFFSKIGGNTFPVYILHTYLLVGVFGINHFIPWMWLKLILCIIGSVAITYGLSRNKVNTVFHKFLKKVNKFIIRD